MEGIEKVRSDGKFLNLVCARISLYKACRIYNTKKYNKILKAEIEELLDQAEERLSKNEMERLLSFFGYPVNKIDELNLSYEALHLCSE